MQQTTLVTTELGQTGLAITRVGFGAWAIGGGAWEFGWGAQDDAESVAAIERALELGVNWIDTAAAYGLGHSETIVRRALEGLGQRPYVFTKAGLIDGGGGRVVNSLKRDSIRREVEASLTRLAVDAIDLYQIHWPNPDRDVEEGWSAFAELKDEGLVRHIGVSNFDVDQLRRAQAIAPVETLQPPYSLVDRAVKAEILPFAERKGIGVIAYSPMGSGLLTGAMTRERIASLADNDWRKHDEHFNEPALSRHLATVERLEAVAERHGTTPGAVAIAWTLTNPAVDAAIVGFRRPAQVDPLLSAARPGAHAGGSRGDRRGLMSLPADSSRRPGRPRSERARQAILRAAADLLLDQGTAQVSMDAVAERAGVSKATIYRWWSSKERLALDALVEWAGTGSSARDTGSLRSDLLALVRPWVREIRRRPFARVIAALLTEAQSDPAFAEDYRRHFVEQRRAPMRAAFERAIARGEAPGDLDVEVALDLIYGPVYHRLLHGHAQITDRFATSVIDLALAGILTSPTAPEV